MDTPTESVKCGSIYMTKEDTLLLACEFCRDNYDTLEELGLHVKYHLPETQTRIKRENSISYSIEYIPPIIQIGCHEILKPECDLDPAEAQFRFGIKRENSISFDSDNETSWKESNLILKDEAVSECLLPSEDCAHSDDQTTSTADTIKSKYNRKQPNISNCSSTVKRRNTSKVIGTIEASIPETPQVIRTLAKSRYSHKCSFCDLCFPENRKLVDHENTHTGRQPYCCKICPKTFAAASSLWSHNKLHTQERLHKCPGCEKMFAHKHMRDRHNREQHLPDTDPQRYFQCTKCDQKFKTHRQMCYHRAIHKNKTESFTCDHCQRQCKSRSILVDHMEKVHLGRKRITKQRTRKREIVID